MVQGETVRLMRSREAEGWDRAWEVRLVLEEGTWKGGDRSADEG